MSRNWRLLVVEVSRDGLTSVVEVSRGQRLFFGGMGGQSRVIKLPERQTFSPTVFLNAQP